MARSLTGFSDTDSVSITIEVLYGWTLEMGIVKAVSTERSSRDTPLRWDWGFQVNCATNDESVGQ